MANRTCTNPVYVDSTYPLCAGLNVGCIDRPSTNMQLATVSFTNMATGVQDSALNTCCRHVAINIPWKGQIKQKTNTRRGHDGLDLTPA